MQPETENNDTQQKNRGGRPKGSTKLKPNDEMFKQINGLGRIQCTQREAAAVLGVEERTFHSFLQLHQKARQAWEDGRDQGRASLRRMQYKSAESGNVTMQIWLGKQLLAQADKVEQKSYHTVVDADDLSDDELAYIIRNGGQQTRASQGGQDEPDPVY